MDYTPSFEGGKYRLDGRTIAELDGSTLHKRVRGSVHLLQQPRRAWAVDAAMLADAERRGGVLVEVVDGESGQVYRAAIALFHQRGFTVSRGYGEQRALALVHWQTGDAMRPPAAVAVQLALGF
jgi:hypothetical protein